MLLWNAGIRALGSDLCFSLKLYCASCWHGNKWQPSQSPHDEQSNWSPGFWQTMLTTIDGRLQTQVYWEVRSQTSLARLPQPIWAQEVQQATQEVRHLWYSHMSFFSHVTTFSENSFPVPNVYLPISSTNEMNSNDKDSLWLNFSWAPLSPFLKQASTLAFVSFLGEPSFSKNPATSTPKPWYLITQAPYLCPWWHLVLSCP